MLRENLVFVREFISEFKTTGACLPTSKWAAEALASPLACERKTQNILEIGPGTGAVTVKILANLMPGDHLTICEINPRFMKELKNRLSTNPDYLKHKDSIEFFEGPVQNLSESRHFHIIVCALPFLNFELPVVEEIFAKLKRISNDKTTMSYYEYIGLRSISRVVAPKDRKKRMKQLDGFFDEMYSRFPVNRRRVWLNVLPINIYTLQLAA